MTWNQEAGSEPQRQHQWLSETAALRPSEGSEVCRECWEGRQLSSTKRLGWGEWHRAPELKSKQKHNQSLLSDANQTSVRPLPLSVGGNTRTRSMIRLNSGMMAYNSYRKFFPSVNTCLFCRLSHLAFLFSALLRGRAFPFWLRCRGVKRFNLQEKTTTDIQWISWGGKKAHTRMSFFFFLTSYLEDVWSTSSRGWLTLDRSRLYLVL